MKRGYWILKDKKPVKVDTVEEWGVMFENTDGRRVAQDTVGDFWISTVFLGMDHNFSSDGPPLLFETMVFDQSCKRPLRLRKDSGEEIESIGEDVYQNRYATWEEAEAGHKEAVEMVKSGEIKGNRNERPQSKTPGEGVSD